MNNKWAVLDMDGAILSRHRTEEAAEDAVERELRAFDRSPYARGGAFLPRSVVRTDRPFSRIDRYSTSWENDWENDDSE